MNERALVTDRTLTDLGLGAQVALFALRACAFRQTECGCVLRALQDFFGESTGERLLDDVDQVAKAIAQTGRRRILLSAPNSIRFTLDEASLVSAVSAAQSGDEALCEGHLHWLLARRPDPELVAYFCRIADRLTARGFDVLPPEEHAVSETPADPPRIVAGNA